MLKLVFSPVLSLSKATLKISIIFNCPLFERNQLLSKLCHVFWFVLLSWSFFYAFCPCIHILRLGILIPAPQQTTPFFNHFIVRFHCLVSKLLSMTKAEPYSCLLLLSEYRWITISPYRITTVGSCVLELVWKVTQVRNQSGHRWNSKYNANTNTNTNMKRYPNSKPNRSVTKFQIQCD